MLKFWRRLLPALLIVGGISAAALADYTILDSASVTRTVKSFVCETTKICTSHVLIKSDGTEVGTAAAPLRTDPVGTTTQPVSIATVPSHAVTNAGTFATQAAATQSGTWTVQPGNTANSTAWLVTGTGGTFPAVLAAETTKVIGTINIAAAQSVTANAGTNLNTSALATSANLTAGTAKTQIVDGAGAVIASTSNNLNVQCANCSGSGVSTADAATFTASTSLFAGSGGFFQTTATNNALTNGQQGMFQTTANRALFVNLRTAAGAEIGTAGAPVRTDPVGTTTQPVSLASVPSHAVTNAGTFATQATLAAETTKVIGTINVAAAQSITANAGTNLNTSALATSANQVAVTAGADAVSNTLSGQAVYGRASWFNGTTWDRAYGDSTSGLWVNIKAGAGVNQASTTAGQVGSLVLCATTTGAPTYVTAQSNAVSCDTSGNIRVTNYPPGTEWAYTAAASGIANTTTAVTITAAAGAGIRNYLTRIDIMCDALTNATEIAVRDGAGGADIWRTKVGTAGLNQSDHRFANPRRSTANTLLEVVTLTASGAGACYINADGYKAP